MFRVTMKKMVKSTTKTVKSAKQVDALYQKARTAATTRLSEDEELNRVCDSRLKEPRQPIEKLLKKLAHELER